LKALNSLDFRYTQSDPKSLTHLRDIRGLRAVTLPMNAAIRDADVEPLFALQELRHISLDLTGIGDATVKQLAKLPHLTVLSLAGTNVSDRAILYLADVPALTYVNLDGLPVSRRTIAVLQNKRPMLQIVGK
jgi:hypothetical protein